MQILFFAFMFVLGAIFGSFLCCQARRLHRQDPSSNPPRSVCLHCGKQLKWHDNIPIISWLALRGKCRYCHKKIGSAEIISEIATALSFLLVATTINVETATALDWAAFISVIVLLLPLTFLAIYDGEWGELPTTFLTISALCAIITLIPAFWAGFSVMPFLSAALFGGIYLALYLVSKGKWVGDGDWLLAGIIGLALGHPWLSLIALFIANFSACLIMSPAFIKAQNKTKKSKKAKNHQIYFGPFLVLSFVITYALADFFISVI